MSQPHLALLPARSILHISGDDAPAFLQGLVSNDIDKLANCVATFAALLTPQGKILFDFFIAKTDDGYLIDVTEDKAAELAKRLTFYRLRAKVQIEDRSEEMIVGALWGDGRNVDPLSAALDDVTLFTDPRLERMGLRFISDPQQFETNADDSDYKRHRLSLGIPEGGEDFIFGATFPHEANMDVLNGIDFEKGCYVGQEVVSRMQHRGSTRKRFVPFIAPGHDSDDTGELAAQGSEIRAGKALIGTMGSSSGARGLALIRLDRAGEMAEKDTPLMSDDNRLELMQPPWAPFTVPGARET